MNKVDHLYSQIKQLITNSNRKDIEIELDGFTLEEKESLRTRLLCSGVPAEFYTEFKKTYIGVLFYR